MRILIADDEVLSRRLLQKTLERAGYEVTALENGRLAAEQLCKRDGPRLALLDWMMPELDGPGVRSEERRVGKEGRCGGVAEHEKKRKWDERTRGSSSKNTKKRVSAVTVEERRD